MKQLKICAAHFKVIIICLVITGCSTSPKFESSAQLNQPLSAHEAITKNSLLDVYKVWKGTPYRLGGNALNGIDCSAFVQTTYSKALGLQLPRTTLAQTKLGQEIEYGQANVGDLVFFKTAPKVRHVGVYLGNQLFMHASTSKGVIISRLDNPYWASKYWHFRRVSYSPEVN
ncbi:hydrolase [Vibrio galatheae]|uniref:Hydrolase n=1 Tax=Vibrio galatheae TaxID=579748 RepID=A0A0F4NEL0_9VIBR|nr:NlpC/P60 family protein [Vibrio galatheae]KJY81530.1 hydrolase [Vibrio galatheae]